MGGRGGVGTRKNVTTQSEEGGRAVELIIRNGSRCIAAHKVKSNKPSLFSVEPVLAFTKPGRSARVSFKIQTDEASLAKLKKIASPSFSGKGCLFLVQTMYRDPSFYGE